MRKRTNSSTTTSPTGPTSSLKVTKTTRIDLIHLGGGIMFPRQFSLSSSSSWRQKSDSWRASGQLHHGVKRDFYSLVPDETFRLPEIQSPGNRRGGVICTPTAHTFFSCAVCQRSCPSLLSQFVLLVVSHLVIDSTHTRGSRAHWLKRNMKLGTLSCPKVFTSPRAMSHVTSLTSGTPSLGTCTLSLTLIRLASTS